MLGMASVFEMSFIMQVVSKMETADVSAAVLASSSGVISVI